MKIRRFYKKSEKRKKLSISQLRKKAITSYRLLNNVLRRSELNITEYPYTDIFKPGLINNSIHVIYENLNLKFSLSVTGKLQIQIKRKKMTTNIIYDKNTVEKIKAFIHEYALNLPH